MEPEEFDSNSPKFETMELINVAAQSFAAAATAVVGMLVAVAGFEIFANRLEARRAKKTPEVPPRPEEK